MNDVGQSRNVLITLLDDAERQHTEIHPDDATPNTLPLPLARPTGSIARVSLAEQEPHPSRVHHALLHRKALLVVPARDPEDVPLELVPDAVAGHFGAHASVHEDAQFTVVVDLDQLLGPVGRVGDVELHLVDVIVVVGGGWSGRVVFEGR